MSTVTSDIDVDDAVAALEAGGAGVDFRPVYLPDRRPVPEHVNLAALRTDIWEWAAVIAWPVLAPGDPNAAVVNAARRRFLADPAFAAALNAAYCRHDGVAADLRLAHAGSGVRP